MHIPDGFVSLPVAATTGLLSATAVGIALKHSQTELGLRRSPVLGLTTAFIFAAQMINFPVTGGTSGHLLGATLAVIILGTPWAATLSITTVLLIQALLFADGGISALGANIFNMAIIGVWVGWILTKTLQRLLGGSKKRLPLAGGIAAGISVVAAAIACAIELALSGTAPTNLVLPAMTGIHILIGVGEGLITGGVISYINIAQPDLLPGEEPQLNKWLVPIVTICLIAGMFSLFASALPDGLEWVAAQYNFKDKEAESLLISLFPDYKVPGLDENLGTSIAGIFGTAISFAAAFGIAEIFKPKDV